MHIRYVPLTYSVTYEHQTVLKSTHPSMTTEQAKWGRDRLCSIDRKSVKDTLFPICGKQTLLVDEYNEIILTYPRYKVVFRAYNEGVAYRFMGCSDDSLVVYAESAPLRLANDPEVWFADSSVLSSWAIANKHYSHLSAIPNDRFAITPMVMKDSVMGLSYVIAESDVQEYPGLYIRKQNDQWGGYWAASPAAEHFGSWGNRVLVPTNRHPWLARTSGRHAFPWRIFIIVEEDKKLLTNEMVYLLAEPSRLTRTDWIRPGKATWEWWNCHTVASAPFDDAGLSTELYKYYIDFAAQNGIEYLLVDEGWCGLLTPDQPYPSIDIREVIRYGQTKSVGTWLWVSAAALIKDRMSVSPNHCLDSIAAWGAAGVKVDFFDRDDNLMQHEYAAIAEECAKRRLMVIYHGCGKPTGLQRTYPNLINLEAVRGQECSKWDRTANPQERTEILYARQLAGPIDYTPGSMRNRTPSSFVPVDPGLPNTLGTRSQEIALFIVLDQPFAMLCDSPDEYRRWPDVLSFLSSVPTTWEETIALKGTIGQDAVLAKRKGDIWYVGGITNWEGRTVNVDFSFLDPDRTYQMIGFYDTDNSETDASSYRCDTSNVAATDTLLLRMACGGGFALKLTPAQ